MGSRNMKTCRRRAGGNFNLRAALDRVGILTVCSGEDAMQQTALLPAEERLLAGDAQLRLDPRPVIRQTMELCFHAFQVPLQRDATDSVSDCEVRTREPAQEDAAAMATEGVEDWAECEQKGLFRYATRSRCIVSVSASAPVPASASVSLLRGSFFISKVSNPSGNPGRDSSF